MARIKIELPDRFAFSTEVPIHIGLINYGHHLDNAALLSLVSEARVRFFKSLGYTELDVDGVGIVVADAAMQYKSEAFHGETLRVQMQPADFNRYGFDLVFRMTEVSQGREVARGKTGIVFIDPDTRRVTPVPAAVLHKLQRSALREG